MSTNVVPLPKPKKLGKIIEKTKRPGIYKVIYPSGKISWKAIAFNKGTQMTETFSQENLAINWKRTNDQHAEEKRAFKTNRLFEKVRASELVDVYLNGGAINDREVEGGIGIKGNPLGPTTKAYLKKFIEWLKANGNPTLTEFDQDAATQYLNMRRREMYQSKGWKYERKVKPPSVKREKVCLQPIWKLARHEWGFKGLDNPWTGLLPIAGSDRVKERRLNEGELTALVEASSHCYGRHKFYVPYVLHLAIETGMRPIEYFELKWKDVDLKKRRILVRKSKKNDIQRMIVMTNPVLVSLVALRCRVLYHHDKDLRNKSLASVLDTKGNTDYILYPDVFGHNEKGERVAQERFNMAFKKARKIAGLYDPNPETMKDRLTLYTLRHEADSRFLEALEEPYMVKRMMGHKIKGDMTIRYDTWTQDDGQLKKIEERLDKWFEKDNSIPPEILSEEEKAQAIDVTGQAFALAFKLLGIGKAVQSPLTDLTQREERDLEEWKASLNIERD